MQQADLSRREFVLGTAGALVTASVVRGRQRPDLTAQLVADRIKSSLGVAWREKTTDGFKAGNPATVVTGIATITMGTPDVLRLAAVTGRNMIITQEPVFYSANDEPGHRAADSVYLEKKAFIERNRLVVWRFSDHWNAGKPNESARALASRLGWAKQELPDAEQIYRIPDTTLGALTAHVRNRLAVLGGLRVVGEPGLPVRTVFVNPGSVTVSIAIEALRRADVILAGEPREWEAVPYVLDTWSSNRGKGMIAVGRVVSETPGMEACAAWIRTLVPEVRVEAIATPDPYWNPRS